MHRRTLTCHFLKLVIWRSIEELILERIHFIVISLPSHFQKGHSLKKLRTPTGEKPFPCDQCTKSFSVNGNIKKHILKRNHFLMVSVPSNFFKLVIWKHIEVLILERNYFVAISVPSHFQKVAVWRSIEELILKRNHFLWSVHQVIFRKWLFKATQKNTFWRETISSWLVSLVIFYSWSF